MRSASELIHPEDALGMLREWAAAAPHPVELLARDEADGTRVLEWLQISTRSPLGAVAYHTGGVLIDGWLRVLGAGGPMRALDTWNHEHGHPIGILVADDALGGVFAWARSNQHMAYFAPDTAEWEDLGVGYTDWLFGMCTERFAAFYEDDRTDLVPGPDQALLHYPPLFANSPGPRQVTPVPMAQVWHLHRSFADFAAGR
ncbi:MAG: DUF2625 family protein [Deltaproteobacteria bacterium]|nr:MAG: DUF2625 family protein [Deltaproteobacteria bacterium]